MNPSILTLEAKLFNPFVPKLEIKGAWGLSSGAWRRRRCYLMKAGKFVGQSEGGIRRRRGTPHETLWPTGGEGRGRPGRRRVRCQLWGPERKPGLNIRKCGWGP